MQQATVEQANIHRVYRKRQTDRYAVVIDSEGSAGSAHYEFELKMLAERPVEKSTDTRVAVTFLNLRSKFGDMKAPERKMFGSANYQFPTTGFPLDFSLAGNDATFVIPILSWYLPTDAVAVNVDFKVPDMVFDGSIHASGVGDVVKLDGSSATIKLNLGFTGSQTDASATPPAFNSKATFSVKTGVLLSSEGTMSGPTGSMTFHLKKV